MLLVAVSTMRRFISCIGLWMPGVSKSTICAPGRFTHGEDAVARRLGLVGDDRDLLAHQPVHEGGLADVRAAHHRHEPGAERGRRRRSSLTPGSPTGTRRKRTRLTRLLLGGEHLDLEAAVAACARPPAGSGRRSTSRGRPRCRSPRRSRARSRAPARAGRRSTRPVRHHAAVGLDRERLALDVVLVLDLAHQLLDDVLDGDDPAVPPYSSMTTAKVTRRPCISRRSSAMRLVSGHEVDGPHEAAQRAAPASPSKSSRSRTSTTPRMSSRSLPKTGIRLYLVSRISRRSSATGAAGGDRDDVGPRASSPRARASREKRSSASTSRASSASLHRRRRRPRARGALSVGLVRAPGPRRRRSRATSGLERPAPRGGTRAAAAGSERSGSCRTRRRARSGGRAAGTPS